MTLRAYTVSSSPFAFLAAYFFIVSENRPKLRISVKGNQAEGNLHNICRRHFWRRSIYTQHTPLCVLFSPFISLSIINPSHTLQHHPFLTMKSSIAISGLVFLLAQITADARLLNEAKRLRVDAKEEESGFRSRVNQRSSRMEMNEHRFLDADLSMSMSEACATLNKKQCKWEGTCTWDGSACTQGTSVPTYSPTMDQSDSPTGPYPTSSPISAAETLTIKAGCALHSKKKPCLKDVNLDCSWDGSVCSDEKRMLRAN